MRDVFVETACGRLHALVAGSGPPLLLLHSNGCSGHEFVPVLDSFGAHCTTYALDLPGHGDSDPMARHHSVEMHGAAVIAFMNAQGIQRAALSGSSIGGLIAIQLVRDHRSRLSAVSLVETPLRTYDWWGTQWSRIERSFTNTAQTFDEVAPRFLQLTPEVHERWNIDRRKVGAKAMMDVMWAGREFDAIGALAAVAESGLPLQVAIGTRGPIGDLVEEFKRRLPDAEHVLFDDCGHFPMIDDPRRFAEALTAFFLKANAST